MNIGEAARRSGVNAKAIRYYESIGLIPEPVRTDGGYRQYHREDVERLKMVGRARRLGFGIEEVRRLVDVYDDQDRVKSDVKDLVMQHVAEVDRKITELNAIRSTLLDMATKCVDDGSSECAILGELSA